MSEFDYTGNKTKNYFTAYLQKCIWWKRQEYLKKKSNISNKENFLDEDLPLEYCTTMEETLKLYQREELIFKETKGIYPDWNELSNQRLTNSILLLREDERCFIYQHVFEEKSFKEIGYLNGLQEDEVKSVYYYAIRKIRKWMGGIR